MDCKKFGSKLTTLVGTRAKRVKHLASFYVIFICRSVDIKVYSDIIYTVPI
jgi:hypothetical protein